MKRITFLSALSALLFMGYCSNAKGTKTADAKTTETVAAPAESKTTTGTTTYYVTGQLDANHWEISTDPANAADCDGGSIPCQFTSTNNNLGSSVSKSDVSTGAQGITVIDTRSSL